MRGIGNHQVSDLVTVPLELREANDFIRRFHRHHAPVVGHRFSIGATTNTGLLVGVCVVGRPVARLAGSPRDVAEVTRLATDGTYNACSILYSAAARACKAMGFRRIQTYTLPSEGGASLRASGWICEGEAGGGQWKHTDGKPRRSDQPTEKKYKWSLTFARPEMTLVMPNHVSAAYIQETLT